MRQFYLSHEKLQSVTGKLTWSQYCELYMPKKEQLIAQVEAVLKKREENESES